MDLRHYELMMILDPNVEERTLGADVEKMLKVVTADGGSVENVDVWGKRRLAYEINKLNEGVYVVVDFKSSTDTAKELDRQLGLNESVLRTKLLRKDQA